MIRRLTENEEKTAENKDIQTNKDKTECGLKKE